MKPAINTNKHADDLGSSSPQRSPANKVLVILATVVIDAGRGERCGAKRHRNVQRIDLAPVNGASTIPTIAKRT